MVNIPILSMSDEELSKIAYALRVVFGVHDEIAQRIYDHIKQPEGLI